jgi:hypothetical protein
MQAGRHGWLLVLAVGGMIPSGIAAQTTMTQEQRDHRVLALTYRNLMVRQFNQPYPPNLYFLNFAARRANEHQQLGNTIHPPHDLTGEFLQVTTLQQLNGSGAPFHFGHPNFASGHAPGGERVDVFRPLPQGQQPVLAPENPPLGKRVDWDVPGQAQAPRAPVRPVAGNPPVNMAAVVREEASRTGRDAWTGLFLDSPGEKELELARLWSRADPVKAQAYYEQALRLAGPDSEVARVAHRELERGNWQAKLPAAGAPGP